MQLQIPLDDLIIRAVRKCARQHSRRMAWPLPITPLPRDEFAIDRIYFFHPSAHVEGCDIGTITLTYDREGHRAEYGFGPTGRLTLYAD